MKKKTISAERSRTLWLAVPLAALLCATPAPAQEKKRVVEEIVARVNNEIIPLSDAEHARASLRQEIEQECRGCTATQIQERLREKEKNLIRDLIDQSLLAQRGKDLGIKVDTEVVKQLDQIRQQNNFQSMEELEKAVTASGIPFEEFKSSIRNNLLTREVIRREVGSSIIISSEDIRKYYEEHKNEFVRPEMVYLSELFVSTEGKGEAEIPKLEQKARNLLERLKKGEDFGELAKRYSDGSTAQQGGELGGFERGKLAKELEDIVFKLNRGEQTDVIRTKTGFLILKVEQRYEAGLQPLEKVEGEIMGRLHYERMPDKLRKYLGKLREESYILVKPGYVDTAAMATTPIVEVAPAADEAKGKKKKGKGKKSGE